MPVGEAAEQHEVRVGLGGAQALLAEPGDQGVALVPQVVDPGQQLVGVLQCDRGDGLGDGRQVVRQAHDPAGVDDRRRRRQVAEPPAGEGERLRHGAGDDQVGAGRQQLQGRRHAVADELLVGLVGDHDPGTGLAEPADVVQAGRGAGRVVRRADQDHVRLLQPDLLQGGVDVDGEVVAPRHVDVAAVGVTGVLGVHRVRRAERHHRPVRTGEGLEQVDHHLVRPVRGPDMVQRQPVATPVEVAGQRGAQPGRLPVRVAVHRRRGPRRGHGDVGADRLTGAVRVLVDVEAVRDVELRGAVRLLADQFGTQRQVGQPHAGRGAGGGLRGHERLPCGSSIRTRSAWACEGRSSDSANTITSLATASVAPWS